VTRRLSISCAIIPAQIASASYAWSRRCGPGITHPSAWRGYYGHTRRYGPKLDAAHDLMALLTFSLACSMHEAGVQVWKGSFRADYIRAFWPPARRSPPQHRARMRSHASPTPHCIARRAPGDVPGAAASSSSRWARRLGRARAIDACCWWHRRCRGNARGSSARLVGRQWTLCRTNAWLYRRLRTDCLRLHAWFAWWLRCLPCPVNSVRACSLSPKSRHSAPLGQSVVRGATAVAPLNGAA
jgi:hypothetical protein